jgi:hypothetical protein
MLVLWSRGTPSPSPEVLLLMVGWLFGVKLGLCVAARKI